MRHVTLRRLQVNKYIIRAITTYHPFANSSDQELLEKLSDGTVAAEAFEEFYNRFKDFVMKICRKACRSFDDSNQLADDIFQQTFLKVFYKGHTFRKKDNTLKDNHTAEIKSWLSRIAKNELIDFLRRNPDEKLLMLSGRKKSEELGNLPTVVNEQEENLKPPTIHEKVLAEALAGLSESERLVLMTYMQYYDRQTPNSHLPDEIIKNLVEKLGVKAASLRQIKARAIQKIRKTVEKMHN